MKIHRSTDSRTAGFSLLELIVVIAIITLLAGILTPLVKSSLDDAKVAKVVSLVDAVKKASMKYWYDTDLFATQDGLLVSTGVTPASKWKGPYLDAPLSAAANPFGGGAVTLMNKLTGYGTGGLGTGGGGYADIGGISTNDVAETVDGGQLMIPGVPIDHARGLDRAIDGTAASSETPSAGMVEFDGSSTTTTDVYIYLFKK